MIYDYHVHTYHSDDSEYPMEQVVLDAISMGLREICITDHVDYGIKLDPEGKTEEELKGKVTNVDYPVYFNEVTGLRDKYKDKIAVKLGMEFGIQTHTIGDFEKLFARYPFDFIIASCHQVGDKEFWNQDFQKGRSQKDYNESYYEELLNVIGKYKNYSVLGHLDLINRYDEAGIYPFEKVREVVAEILRTAIADGKGIEVNTSSFRYGLKDLTPSRNILKLYKDMGGKVLTLGSDSHKPSHLGAHISAVMEELAAMGFEYYCTFDKMEPVFHKFGD